MSETTNRQVSSAIIYGIEDCPPFKEALFAALQHLLAIFVAICQLAVNYCRSVES